MGEMKEPDVSMKETNFLAGLFQKIVDDCKTELPLFDEFLGKSVKLQGQLKSTSIVFGSFLDTFQKIADCASNTKGSSTDLGICLTRMVLRHRAIEAHLKTLTSALTDCCTFPIQTKKEEWKRRVCQLEKDHSRQFKKTRTVLKKRAESVVKLDKKMKKGKADPELVKLRESLVKDHQLKTKLFEEQERAAVREIACQERTHYTTFAACLKPLVTEEFAMLREVEQLDGVMEKVNKIIMDPFKNLENSDDILSFVKHSEESFCFSTPPSTPSHSSLGSRTGSVRSINSFSRPPSVASSKDTESLASRTNSFSSDKDLYCRANKRSSTISSFSQDSGFTSQDAFSIRPNISHGQTSKAPSRQCSPQSQVPGARCQGQAGRPQLAGPQQAGRPQPAGPPLTGRPHLYSQGQGYTVGGSPARNYSTVKRCHSPYQQPSQGGHYAAPVTCRPPLPHRSKPPPPLRCSSLDRGAARAEERGAQSPPHYSAPANNTPIPPVAPRLSQGPEYGNLGALASPGGASHYGSPGGVTLLGSPGGVTLLGSPGEDSKTPTNERLSILEFQSDSVSSSSSGGSIGSSSSGYSSQGPGPQYSSKDPGPQYSSKDPGPQYSSQGPGQGPQYSSQGTLCSRNSSRQPAGRPPLPPQALPCPALEQGEEVTPHSSMEQLPPPPAAFLRASGEQEQGGQGRFREQDERAKLILALNARLSCSLLDQGQEERSSSALEGRGQAGQERRAVSAHERTATGGERAPQGSGPMERRGVAPSPPVRSLYGGRRSKEEAAVYSNTGPQPVFYM